eukprot:5556591-Ditylum_brightwellii.AAC.1
MRIIDCAHAWAPSTLDTYKSQIAWIQCFQQKYDLIALDPLELQAPPHNPPIPLMWAIQDYALTLPSSTTGKQHLQFNTICGLRSAAAY